MLSALYVQQLRAPASNRPGQRFRFPLSECPARISCNDSLATTPGTRFNESLSRYVPVWISFITIFIHDVLFSSLWRLSARTTRERWHSVWSEDTRNAFLVFLEQRRKSFLFSVLPDLRQLLCTCISNLQNFLSWFCCTTYREKSYNIGLRDDAQTRIATTHVSSIIWIFCDVSCRHSDWVIVRLRWISARWRVPILWI